MNLDIEKKFKKLRTKMLSQDEKRVLWTNIAHKLEANASGTSAWERLGALVTAHKKYVYTAVLVAFLATNVGMTFAAADNARPGEFLFPLDLVGEKIVLAIVFGDKENELRIKFSQERLDEARAAVEEFLAELETFSEIETIEVNPGASTSTDPTSSTPSEASTSTPNTTSAPDATSTPEATSTPDETANSSESDIDDVALENLTNVNAALEVALEYINRTRDDLLEQGNDAALSAIDSIIAELNTLALEHLNDIEEIETKIIASGNKLKVEVKASGENFKVKFKLDQKPRDEGGENSEVKIVTKNDDSKIKIKTGDIKIEFQQKIGDNSDDEDRDDEDRKEKKQHKKDKKKDKKHKHNDDDEDDEDGDSDNGDGDNVPPVISSVTSTDIASSAVTITWDSDEPVRGIVFYSQTQGFDVADAQAHDNVTYEMNVSLTLSELDANTTYYFKARSEDEAGNSTVSEEMSFITLAEADITAPVVSNVSSVPATSSVQVAWETDELTNSKIIYNTDPSVLNSTTSNEIAASDLILIHTLVVDGLTPETTYYFVVQSEDGAGNKASSNELSFTTLAPEAPADIDPPVISAIHTTSTGATSTDIVWTTDEDATSKVLYGTSTPVSSSSATLVENVTLLSDHVINLSDLMADTTYYYIVESEDAVGNNAVFAELSFQTLP